MSDTMCGVCRHPTPGHEPNCPVLTGEPQRGWQPGLADMDYIPGPPQPAPKTNLDRKNELLRLAAKYIREFAPEGTIFYDGAQCDGSCLADDCEAAAEE